MLDFVPFTGSRRIMTDSYIQFCSRWPTVVVGLQSRMRYPLLPPLSAQINTLYPGVRGYPISRHQRGECLFPRQNWPCSESSLRSPAQVEFRIVDASGNRLGDVRVGEIVHIDLDRLAFRLPFLPELR